ncbi:hypothetical protein OUZ56_032193 [Daphnia magna]|uniref:Uncharacterized protein n=1 Tax=Daphnia magna TaxID=35525 RepID=A0ABQ9ZWS5_9CRUS|nr:hypothetical protein OUZ56_032193 [Daphnia magna]
MCFALSPLECNLVSTRRSQRVETVTATSQWDYSGPLIGSLLLLTLKPLHPFCLWCVSSKTSCVARFPQMRKSHLCPSWSAAAAASYGETIFFTCSSLLAEEFRLLPEIRLLQGNEQQTIYKQ